MSTQVTNINGIYEIYAQRIGGACNEITQGFRKDSDELINYLSLAIVASDITLVRKDSDMKTRFGLPVIAALAVTGLVITPACGSKKKDSPAATNTDTVAANPAALAYPTNLAITAFPASTSTSLTEVDATDGTGAAKIDEQAKILRGEGDSCLPKVMSQSDKDATTNDCYEFDQDMLYGTGPNGKTFGTKNGKDTATEACLVGFSRAQVKRVVGHVDRSLAMAQIALCQRKKAGETAQPGVGETIDLAPFMKTAMPKATVTTATMTRQADASDGAKVFNMSFNLTRPDGIPMIVKITHSPKNDTKSSYTGVVYTQISEKNAAGTAEPMTRLISIMYDRTDDAMKYSLRTGRFATGLVAGAIGSDGQVDFNTGAEFTAPSTDDANYGKYTAYAQPNDAVSGMTAISFEGNATTNEGTFSYWQNPGGNYRERARGLLASMVYDAATGTLSGCAVSGAAVSDLGIGTSIRSSVKETIALSPNGAYHPFFKTGAGNNDCGNVSTSASTDANGKFYFCPSVPTIKWYEPNADLGANGVKFATEQTPAFYTRQCFKQNATTALYEIDTAKTTSASGYELVAVADTTKRIAPPGKPAPGVGVKRQ